MIKKIRDTFHKVFGFKCCCGDYVGPLSKHVQRWGTWLYGSYGRQCDTCKRVYIAEDGYYSLTKEEDDSHSK